MPTEFTPIAAIVGGLLIGAAILVLFHTLGRIAGVSGMISGAFRKATPGPERAWRFAFLGGLLLGPVVAIQLTGQSAHPALASELAGADRGRPGGGARHGHGQWLHQRSRRLRRLAPVAPVHRRHRRLHGLRIPHRVRRTPLLGRRLT